MVISSIHNHSVTVNTLIDFFGVGCVVTFQERLAELHSRRSVLKKDAAKAAGLSLMGYYRYEKGDREPTLSTLLRLADFFDVSLDYLCGRSDNPNSHKAQP